MRRGSRAAPDCIREWLGTVTQQASDRYQFVLPSSSAGCGLLALLAVHFLKEGYANRVGLGSELGDLGSYGSDLFACEWREATELTLWPGRAVKLVDLTTVTSVEDRVRWATRSGHGNNRYGDNGLCPAPHGQLRLYALKRTGRRERAHLA